MGASDLFARHVYIRLADDGTGFHYAIKYGGVPVRRAFVPTFREDAGPGNGHLPFWRSEQEDHPAGEHANRDTEDA